VHLTSLVHSAGVDAHDRPPFVMGADECHVRAACVLVLERARITVRAKLFRDGDGVERFGVVTNQTLFHTEVGTDLTFGAQGTGAGDRAFVFVEAYGSAGDLTSAENAFLGKPEPFVTPIIARAGDEEV